MPNRSLRLALVLVVIIFLSLVVKFDFRQVLALIGAPRKLTTFTTENQGFKFQSPSTAPQTFINVDLGLGNPMLGFKSGTGGADSMLLSAPTNGKPGFYIYAKDPTNVNNKNVFSLFPGSVCAQNSSGCASLMASTDGGSTWRFTELFANDYYIKKIDKWASQLSGATQSQLSELRTDFCYAITASRWAAPSCDKGFYTKALIKATGISLEGSRLVWDGDGYGAVCCYAKAIDDPQGLRTQLRDIFDQKNRSTKSSTENRGFVVIESVGSSYNDIVQDCVNRPRKYYSDTDGKIICPVSDAISF